MSSQCVKMRTIKSVELVRPKGVGAALVARRIVNHHSRLTAHVTPPSPLKSITDPRLQARLSDPTPPERNCGEALKVQITNYGLRQDWQPEPQFGKARSMETSTKFPTEIPNAEDTKILGKCLGSVDGPISLHTNQSYVLPYESGVRRPSAALGILMACY